MFDSKKPDPFFHSLHEIALNVQKAAHYAEDFKVTTVQDLQDLALQMKKYETAGDKLVHDLIERLNNAFMTPIEREDILALAVRMDDVIDGLEHFTAHLEIYSLLEIDDSMRTFVNLIVKASDEMVKAMELLQKKKLLAMRDHSILIKDFERKCDEVFRSSLKQLFVTETNPIRIIQFKDLYEKLEEIADYTQNVANTVETIIMRNA
ncbi:hypothetical protein CQS04_11720 [Chryseomicrobium excrementi]|uniref:DUF47 domain-containing protein n=1 Tax=Chryseomicrobium excrementi TaxID=2041346 RepID=A0A2M9EXF6_9BACL|nr:DUF47 domain-containing protein [Chryseomicrobium excrementi]PJK15897.1 hypothetical protein CQS04_11720 [Chryseomicrobium excrementi]